MNDLPALRIVARQRAVILNGVVFQGLIHEGLIHEGLIHHSMGGSLPKTLQG